MEQLWTGWWYRRPRLRRQLPCKSCGRPLTEREHTVCGYCELAAEAS